MQDTVRNTGILSSPPKNTRDIFFSRFLWVCVNIWRVVKQKVGLISVCVCLYVYTYVVCMHMYLDTDLEKTVYLSVGIRLNTRVPIYIIYVYL